MQLVLCVFLKRALKRRVREFSCSSSSSSSLHEKQPQQQQQQQPLSPAAAAVDVLDQSARVLLLFLYLVFTIGYSREKRTILSPRTILS